MKQELTSRMMAEFPRLFKVKQPAKSMFDQYQFECRDGWINLICLLAIELEKECNQQQLATPDWPSVIQVKESLGKLRFVTRMKPNKKIRAIIASAQEQSQYVCEVCGQPGILHNDSGRLRTRCESCFIL